MMCTYIRSVFNGTLLDRLCSSKIVQPDVRGVGLRREVHASGGAPAVLRRAGDGAGVHELPGWSHEHELVEEGQGLRMDF